MKKLKFLNVAEVGLGDRAVHGLIKVLERVSIIDLNISWNSISPLAAVFLFENLVYNQDLRFLDYSWNTLGHEDVMDEVYLFITEHA